jgi:CheY-like chemotaxis protein
MSHQHALLLVDDDADARRALKELLGLHGYEVSVATDGEDALAQLGRGLAPCLVLLDLHMPRMSGWDFRRAQLRDPALRALPVAVFSGDAHEEAAAAELGIHLFVRKPVDIDRLLATIDAHCERAA